jgi:hypothetical protein
VTWVRARIISDQSRGRTKYNRSRPGITNSHALDAACVGEVGTLVGWHIPSTQITATGRGDYCRTNLDRHGFSRGYYTRRKQVRGLQTVDRIRAPKGARKGVHVGRLAVRVASSFRVGNADGINAKYCKRLSLRGRLSHAGAPDRCACGPKWGQQIGRDRLTIRLAALSAG